MRNAFEILGVPPHADAAEIKRAYRELAKVWHPDRFTSDPSLRRRAEEMLKDINRAYAEASNGPSPVQSPRRHEPEWYEAHRRATEAETARAAAEPKRRASFVPYIAASALLFVGAALILAYPTETVPTRADCEALTRARRSGPALVCLQQVLSQTPNDSLAWLALGHLNLKRAHYRDAESNFNHAIEIDPGHAPAYWALGQTYRALGQFLGEVAAYRDALERAPDFGPAHVALGLALYRDGQHQEALLTWERALAADPTAPSAHYYKGVVHYRLGDPLSAAVAFGAAAAIDPSWAEAHFKRGRVLERLGWHDGARHAYRDALAADRDHDRARLNLDRLLKQSL